ncbi:hypothetical protein [Bradyrhizobium sp. NP1]|uniref:hypothetical protein n=1 Tax=Bradyrhizobium sp. NP1 TaxID=3049772 RepID=UPI0025A4E487|nr:hypothetical protein [Bradyrhizobium sp. NP1]WJR75090.1 hypothetical protein QOU61_19965 [Bradyrhizobium sp. NP1]
MARVLADNIHLVRVTTDDRQHQFWIAATSRETAVDRVLDAIPEGWTASLLEGALQAPEAVKLNIAPGEVRQLSY